ncbi:hypothetical protein [Oceanibium sediminis]|uniref:hypothetical protein n=1 Tax=Oceanibium sediminis TaxID=2026339 RepID=UPI000DD37984|nr:hypothetical protein [Oceanibium sediminis]
MIRVVLLGTSHLGAIKQGWDAISLRTEGITIEFFGAPRQEFFQFQLDRDLILRAPDRVGKATLKILEGLGQSTEIDLSSADVVVVAGYITEAELVEQFFRHHNVDGFPKSGKKPPMSRAAFEAFLEDTVDRAMPPPLWHGWKNQRLILLGGPRRAYRDFDGEAFEHTKPLPPETAPKAYDKLATLVKAKLEKLGIEHLPQPVSTIAAHGYTHPKFNLRSGGLRQSIAMDPRKTNNSGDRRHMNADYGVEVWRSLLEHLGLPAPEIDMEPN